MLRRSSSQGPKNGSVYKVVAVCRISDLNKQNELSLDDQESRYREYLKSELDLPFELQTVRGSGSGEWLDRIELTQLEEKIVSGDTDIVICEDLGRIMRRMQVLDFCEMCEDFDTQLIALADHVDTRDDGWEDQAIISAWHHQRHNRDLAGRIRRSLRNRFSNGGIVQTTIFGYERFGGSSQDKDLRKLPEAEAIYDEWFTRLERGDSFSSVADWLNKKGVPVGPYCRAKRWNGGMVSCVTFNPILKGFRLRNRKISKRINKTGRRKCVDAPSDQLLVRNCPHLIFIEPERYDRVIRMLRDRNAKFANKSSEQRNQRPGSKKKTKFPSQHVTCAWCGRPYYWGGHGQVPRLMCSGAAKYKCANGVTFNGVVGARLLLEAILSAIEELPDFDDTFLHLVTEEARKIERDAAAGHSQAETRLASIDAKLSRVTDAIAENGGGRSLLEKLRELERERDEVVQELDRIRSLPREVASIPSLAEAKGNLRNALTSLRLDDPDLHHILRTLVPEIVVQPVRLIDGGHPVLRAKLKVNLVSMILPAHRDLLDHDRFHRELVVDLYDPPQREAYRERVVSLRKQGMTERQIAKQLGITQPAVQHAAALQRRMDSLGLVDPYQELSEPPADYGRLRRHKHSRFQGTRSSLDE